MPTRSTREDELADEIRPGWCWAYNALLDEYGPRIGAYGIAVYMAMRRFATNGSGRCVMSLSRIGELIGASRRHVIRTIQILEKEGLIAVDRAPAQRQRADHVRNVYRMLDPFSPTRTKPSTSAQQVPEDRSAGDSGAPGLVTDSHQAGDSGAPGLVTDSHPKKTKYKTKNKTESSPAAGGVDPEGSGTPPTPAAPAEDAGEILREWAALMGRPPSRADRTEAVTLVAQYGTGLVVYGVLRSWALAQQRPRCLRYCRAAIAEAHEAPLGGTALDAAIAQLRRGIGRGWTREKLGPGMQLAGDRAPPAPG